MENKKILLTGSSGFLGMYISNFLESKKYNVLKLGRGLNSEIKFDLTHDNIPKVSVDFVVHVAGKVHSIPKDKQEEIDFFNVNYLGTKKILSCLDLKKIKTIIFISTVAVYGKDTGDMLNEETPLGGNTAYALSKIKAEKAVTNYGIKNNIKTVILRLPLITGKNPQGNLNSIIKAIKKGYYFRIGKGEAKKSIISAIDIVNLIPELFNLNGIYNLTDINHPKISEIDSIIANQYNIRIKTIPIYLIKFIAKIGDRFPFLPFNSSKFDKLTKSLTFSNEKLLNEIKYIPSRGLLEIEKNLNN